LFFLDYVASAHLEPERVAALVSGMAAACREAGCALLGGETAEMPGVYAAGELDVVGTIVGVAERSALLPRADVAAGDVLIGLASSGPHTNGFSLIRRIYADLPLDTVQPGMDEPLADLLLAPHRSYLPLVVPLLASPERPVKALVHLTGGAFVENIPRVLPPGLGARVRLGSWPVPPLFKDLQARGQVVTAEMYRVFNMGLGLIIVASAAAAQPVLDALPEPAWIIGEVAAGVPGVELA
jgi:phosphoribosylaminoimidazole synthetase